VSDLKEALKGSSIGEIKAKQEALTKAMDAVTQGMYSQQQAGGQPGGGASAGASEASQTEDSSAASSSKTGDDGVIDADYTMMDDKK